MELNTRVVVSRISTEDNAFVNRELDVAIYLFIYKFVQLTVQKVQVKLQSEQEM